MIKLSCLDSVNQVMLSSMCKIPSGHTGGGLGRDVQLTKPTNHTGGRAGSWHCIDHTLDRPVQPLDTDGIQRVVHPKGS